MKVKITGLTFWQHIHLRMIIALSRLHLDAPVRIEFSAPIMSRHYHSLWYGGELGVIHYKGWKFSIYACGDVRANLYDAKDGNRHLEFVKDKANFGVFGEVMGQYFPNDRQLIKALVYKHPRYYLEMQDNNWWECFVIDPSGYRHDMMWAMDAWDLFPAVADVLADMDMFIEDLSEAGNEE